MQENTANDVHKWIHRMSEQIKDKRGLVVDTTEQAINYVDNKSISSNWIDYYA